MSQNAWKPQTNAIHQGVYKDKTFNSVTTPIYPSSNFYFDKVGVHRGYDYTRSGNPTRKALEENIAALEGGTAAWATATGMAALTVALLLLRAGDHIIAGDDIYGGTWRLLDSVAPRMGIEVSFVNMRTIEPARGAIRANTRALLIETPSNPLLNLVDLEAMCGLARERGLISIVDNTFMSPYWQSPFQFGADVIVHSTTKYINGHSDVVGGAVVVREAAHGEPIGFLVNAMGLGQAPFDSWLVLRGVKTLAQRMEAHERGARAVAEWLNGHPAVTKVYYPGLPAHPGHALAKKQMRGFGGMVSFDLNMAKVQPEDFFSRLRLFLLAESLGGVESLAEQPWTMSHASMTEAARQAGGITPATVRLSIGLEHPDDLIADLADGLGKRNPT